MMSSGGLINNLTLLKKIKKCEIFVPSGAISGLDSIKSISERLNSLTLTTTKPVAGLNNAPYILKNKINLNKIKSKKTIFSGNLSEAVSGFPKNINVAATLFLATGFKHIEIKIIADPKTKSNTHEIEAIGKFEKIKTITISLPGENPKSSYLAVLSAINLLDNIKNNKRIGN
jgi:aspartate dehydrogenase